MTVPTFLALINYSVWRPFFLNVKGVKWSRTLSIVHFQISMHLNYFLDNGTMQWAESWFLYIFLDSFKVFIYFSFNLGRPFSETLFLKVHVQRVYQWGTIPFTKLVNFEINAMTKSAIIKSGIIMILFSLN